MSREFAYLSFFKSKKITYNYQASSQTIEFPCIHCQNTAIMCSQTSHWSCGNCNESGNIVALIEYSKGNSFGEIYFPKKEQKTIINMLERLVQKYPYEKKLLHLESKVKDLINYYEKAPRSP